VSRFRGGEPANPVRLAFFHGHLHARVFLLRRPSQVPVGVDEGLKQASSIHCDELVNIPKSSLISFIGTLSPDKLAALNQALAIAIGINTPA
jgi:hypothetical protein